MYTCYECGKCIKGTIKHTGVPDIARMTGWDLKRDVACDQDFPKAFHPDCWFKSDRAAAIELGAA